MIYYRGLSIDYLFENHDWEEVAYLLIWASLPNKEQKLKLRSDLNAALKTPPAVVATIRQLP